MFLPALGDRVKAPLDVIFVTGDAYVDHPSFGVALLGRYLESRGFSVGIIPQPEIDSGRDISWFGAPRLFWAVTSGAVDSMVANYTASGRRRKSDDYTPGGRNDRRPDRAVVVYANLIRRFFKDQRIVLGGIEASLRRLAHYDWRRDRILRSVLLDAKADAILYGMAERTLLEYARLCRDERFDALTALPGLVWRASEPLAGIETPSFEEAAADKRIFLDFFRLFSAHPASATGKPLIQRTEKSFVVVNPPQIPLASRDLDEIYELEFMREVHPSHLKVGKVGAIETVRTSIVTHRGCFGDCRFCSITSHQGRIVVSRSEASILREVEALSRRRDFHGTITDVGGPSANMYGIGCGRGEPGGCADRRCIGDTICSSLKVDHARYLALLDRLARISGVKHVFVSSGLRHDLIVHDKSPDAALRRLLASHISGRMKIAPEHDSPEVLALMAKPGPETLRAFQRGFAKARSANQFFVCYFIAAHPGATLEDDRRTGAMIRRELKVKPEQVQLFTPTPSTWSTTMYWTGLDPDGKKIFVERSIKRRELHKKAILGE
jgi:uncharacterized radical SAM protein YgiQ